MTAVLRLYEDVLSDNASGMRLPALARMIYVVHGSATIGGTRFGDGAAWHGEGEVTVNAAKRGAPCGRFELAPAGAGEGAATGHGGISSRPNLSAVLAPLPRGDLPLRGDSVPFPP